MSRNPFAGLSPTWQDVPHNIQAEMALLGALLANNKAIERCGALKAEHFAGENLGAVYAAIVDGIDRGGVVDPITLKSEFDPSLLAALTTAMVGIINVADYARVIREAARARELIAIGEALADAARNGLSASDIAAAASQRIDLLMMGDRTASQYSLKQALEAVDAAYDRAASGATSGVSTGFPTIDRRLGGLEPGLVYVLAGRPGMGKSALGHQIAMNVARTGVGVLEMSLEMSHTQLGQRAICAEARIDLSKLKAGRLDLEEASRYQQAKKALGGLLVTIDDTPAQTPAEIAMKCRTARRKHGLGLVMIDHLNLMRPEDGDARHGGTWATERASSMVLQIAKECECPVLLLAQLNRSVEAREDKRPVLSDLRQAGAIEQDAYAVGFVYRSEYYNRVAPEMRDSERTEAFQLRLEDWREKVRREEGKAELIWAKVRDGETGTDTLRFDGSSVSFGEVWS